MVYLPNLGAIEKAIEIDWKDGEKWEERGKK
jgi:hypothetical protein